MTTIRRRARPALPEWEQYATANAVRHRTRSGLRSFSLAEELLASEAKHDRIQYKVRVDISFDSGEQLTQYIDGITGIIAGANRPLFSVGRNPHSRVQRVRGANGMLFKVDGWLRVEGDRRSATMDLNLHLNPTSFLSNQPEDVRPESLRDMPSSQVLRENPDMAAAAKALKLDRNDNFLVGAARQGGTWFDNRARWWHEVLAAYINHVATLLHETLVPSHVNGLPGGAVRIHWSGRNLGFAQVETYWEQKADNAICAVMDFWELIQAPARRAALKLHMPEVGDFTLQNGATIHVDLTPTPNKVVLCIYAATQDVVRIEVRFNRDIRNTVARGRRGRPGMLEMLGLAREKGASYMRRITRALQRDIDGEDPNPSASLARLLARIAVATGNDERATEALLAPFMWFGGVTETLPGGIAPPDVMTALEADGIVRREGLTHTGVRRYVMQPQYRAALRGVRVRWRSQSRDRQQRSNGVLQ